MAESEVKLIGAWASPFVLRSRIALNLKHVQYEFLQETLGAKSELLLKSNPVHKKIPVLIHGGKPVCESLIIVQYIDDVWASSGPSILPSDPYDRAIERFWAAYIDDKLFPSMKGIAAAPDAEGKKAALEQVTSGLTLLEEAFGVCSKGKGFFSGGDHIGFLDIALGSLLGWIKVTELTSGLKLIDPATTPKLAHWAETFRQDPAVSGVMPETQKLAEYAKVLFAKLKGAQPQK
ncbi:glutathione S-transferase U17-like [Humulus lupulus]|uniref:glutathione S-transferase U17-like n=1 Tax=Humulus lupulus TaxID=3486 RepID=UPI002B41501A|nr:glutathione S-transferase U17-like [Humulus lupulus]